MSTEAASGGKYVPVHLRGGNAPTGAAPPAEGGAASRFRREGSERFGGSGGGPGPREGAGGRSFGAFESNRREGGERGAERSDRGPAPSYGAFGGSRREEGGGRREEGGGRFGGREEGSSRFGGREEPAPAADDGADNRFRQAAAEHKASAPAGGDARERPAEGAGAGGFARREMPAAFRSGGASAAREEPAYEKRVMSADFRSPREEGGAPEGAPGGGGRSFGGFGGDRGGREERSERREMPAAFQSQRREAPGGEGGASAPGGDGAPTGMRRWQGAPAGGDAGEGASPGMGGGMGMRREGSGGFGGRDGGGFGGGRFGDRGDRDGGRDGGGAFGGGRYGDRSDRDGGSRFGRSSGGPSGGPAAQTMGPAGRTTNIIEFAAHQQQKARAAAAEKDSAKAQSDKKAAASSSSDANSQAAALASVSLGLDVAKATLARKVQPVFDAYLSDLSKDAVKKAATELGKLRGGSQALTPELARQLVLRAAETEKSGERRQLANLLSGLCKAGKPPVALPSDVMEGIAAAVEHLLNPPAPAATVEEGEEAVAASAPSGPSTDVNLRLRHVLEELGNAKAGAIPVEELPAPVRAFLASPPPVAAGLSSEDVKAALSSIEGTGAWGDLGLGLPVAAAAAPAAAAPKVAESAAAAPAAAAAAPSASSESDDASVDAASVAAGLMEAGLKGGALLEAARGSALARVSAARASAAIAAAVFENLGSSLSEKAMKAPFLAKEQFAPVLAWRGHTSVPGGVELLYALQAALHTLHKQEFPKNVADALMMKLYESDIVSEEAFMAWKDDASRDASVPGKTALVVNSVRFFDFLDQADDESEDSEVEEALKDIVRPNNKASLR